MCVSPGQEHAADRHPEYWIGAPVPVSHPGTIFSMGCWPEQFIPWRDIVKKISYIVAALATIAVTAPAFAQDKPMMGDDGMKKPMTHHMMKKHKMMHHKKMMMKKDGM
jgi:hypothetical protein